MQSSSTFIKISWPIPEVKKKSAVIKDWENIIGYCRSSHLQMFLNMTPTQVFSCENCQIFKNRFFYRTRPVAAYNIGKNPNKAGRWRTS